MRDFDRLIGPPPPSLLPPPIFPVPAGPGFGYPGIGPDAYGFDGGFGGGIGLDPGVGFGAAPVDFAMIPPEYPITTAQPVIGTSSELFVTAPAQTNTSPIVTVTSSDDVEQSAHLAARSRRPPALNPKATSSGCSLIGGSGQESNLGLMILGLVALWQMRRRHGAKR